MTGWEDVTFGSAEGRYKQITPTAGAIIAALSELPPDTAVETMAGPDGVDTPGGVWYYPATRSALIG